MRFKIRFSLLWFLILFTVVACTAGLLGKLYLGAQNQKTAVTMLLDEKAIDPQKAAMIAKLKKQFGASIEIPNESWVEILYDFEIRSRDLEYVIERDLNIQDYVRKKSGFIDWFGVDFCHDVVRVEFNRSVTVEDVGYLRMMSGLQELKIQANPDVEQPREVAALKGLNSLEFLELKHCEIPDIIGLRSLQKLKVWKDGMPNRSLLLPLSLKKLEAFFDLHADQTRLKEDLFPRLAKLEKLSLTFDSNSKGVSGALDSLHQFPNLKRLSIRGSIELDSSGITKLGSLKHLEELSIGKVSGDLFYRRLKEYTPLAALFTKPKLELEVQAIDWQPISKLNKLKQIHLDFDELSVEALQHLCCGAKDLESLSVSSSQLVGDKAMDYIDGLQKLKVLKLGDVKVTRRRLRKFQESHPECEVTQIYWN